ncbi:MAG: transcriptional repressor [Candidatus Muirbacterium halophilum]|nr:transcriptional repressor [Candidatus Muirbacterium halophilum]MCK9474833.1 transcriptional repressor [Candidatus Muirbacterium halophilum]
MINIKKILEEKGVKPSHQRITIMKFMLENKIHPTVEVIYENIIKELPTLSRTTVYNTLKLFELNGLVQPINTGDSELHYDITLDLHAHFKCIECNDIFDIDIVNNDFLDKVKDDGFNILDTQIYFRGICPKCKEKK